MSVACVAHPANCAEAEEVDYRPEIHGVLRARYEMETRDGGQRFQVRNARLTVAGKVAPPVDYFIQTDLCDRGKMKILDAWGRLAISRDLSFQAGQFRMPFGTDCFRAPANYIFANRSFIGKQMCNVRAVGAKLTFAIPFGVNRAVDIEGGAFNPTSISDHDKWVKELAYAAKVGCRVGAVKFATGLQSIEPDSIRINLWGASATWNPGSLTVEGEYMHKHYTNSACRPARGWVIWADYAMPVKAGVFNRASFQARWDGMTPHSSGTRNSEGLLTPGDMARNRITAGATLTYVHKSLHCDLRLDYEKYFYHAGASVATGEGDKICAEMVIRF